MRLQCIASDLCQKELQMFQRKCAETRQLKQNKLCLKSRKCPNKWEMHQFLLELFQCHYHLCLFFIYLFILLYSMVQQLVLPHEEVCSKAEVLKDFLEFLNFLTSGYFRQVYLTGRCMSGYLTGRCMSFSLWDKKKKKWGFVLCTLPDKLWDKHLTQAPSIATGVCKSAPTATKWAPALFWVTCLFSVCNGLNLERNF